VGRYYQTRAIRRIGETFERDHDRKALVVMATGAGKTRTVIALCDLLMRCNWAKRVLFLADRIALVNQAVGAFKKHLPDASPVNLITDKDAEGHVFVSTYPTMMGLIDEAQDGQRRFGVGHFDLVIIDEAHRSVYQKYRAIFAYFDSLLVGLTATPKEEVDRDTYELFDLEKGVPTDAYGMDEAVKDGFLVPPVPVSVPLRFQREGIKYDDLSEDEKDQWDELEWNEEGVVPDNVEAEAVNKWLFNKDTVDKVLAHLMTHGIRVAGGDRLGKTILFAKNQAHADFIAERFDANYPHWRGKFARVITCKVEYAQSLIDDFSAKDKAPHLAVSVDMLDTGIDVPEVVNLLFFKVVRSETKFWQMIGRGTRLCENLFGPDRHKTCFHIFDCCGNLEYFGQNPATVEGSPGESLGKRLLKRRLEAMRELDKRLCQATQMADAPLEVVGDPRSEAELRVALAGVLHDEVAAMNLDNFVVRPKRRVVERYAQASAWTDLTDEAVTELAHDVAGLPSELEPEPEEAKRFDLLILNLQPAHLRRERAFERLRDQVKVIAGLLEEKSAIPMVLAQMELIAEVQTDEWWQDVTMPMLERVRRRLRDLVQFIDRQSRKLVYSDFEDELGPAVEVALPGMRVGDDFERFRAKARAFLRAHQEHVAIHKLRMNRPLTLTDLAELERMLVESGVGGPEDIDRAKQTSHGLGVFVRSLVGMDRQAAKEAMAHFLAGKTLAANQIQFVNLIVDYLTEYGVIEASVLYESPFTDLTPRGPDGLFSPTEIDELFGAIETVRKHAIAS
jgi:type I restriction enzyme, R subunit